MKPITLVALVTVMVLALSGVASADKPVDQTFAIRGYTTFYEYEKLPNGLTSYHLLARSGNPSTSDQAFCQATYGVPCEAICQTFAPATCGVTGYLDGQFTMEEWGQVDFDPQTGQGSGNGKNYGVVTISGSRGQTVLQFNGDTDLQSVKGRFKVRQQAGAGADEDLNGNGGYSGSGGLVFGVTYTGELR